MGLFSSDDNGAEQGRYPSDWNSRRKEVYKEDQYTCQNCGKDGHRGDVELHAHHIKPINEGGSHAKDNLVTLCADCHQKVHSGKTAVDLNQNYLVAMEAAWLVRDVEDIDDAIGVAVSSAGKRLNEADKEYVDVEVGVTGCPSCGDPFDSAFIAADTALVGLLLEIDVWNADTPTHAGEIAKNVLGEALSDVPLSVIDVVEKE